MHTPILFRALAVTAGAVFGLVAVWAALSKRQWLLRFAVVSVMIGCLIPVPALDMAIVLVAQALVVVGGLMLKRPFDSSAGGPPALQTPAGDWRRFSMRELFRLVLLIAGVFCVVSYSPAKVRDSSWRLALMGAGFGVATLAGTWAATGRRRARWRLVALGVVAPLAGIPTAIDTTVGYFRYHAWLWCAVTAGVGALVALWLLLAQCAAIFAVGERHSSQAITTALAAGAFRRAFATVGLVMLSMVVLWLPSVAYYDMLHAPAAVAFPPLPEPNAYDDLLQIAKKLQAIGPIGLLKGPQQKVGVALLQEAHAALDRPGAVSRCDEESAISDAYTFYRLAGDLELLKPRDLAEYELYHDLLKLALMTARGGLLIHRQEATRIGVTGLDGFLRVRHGLAPDEKRTMMADLLAYDTGWDPLSQVRWRDDRSIGWITRISFLYEPWVEVWDSQHRWHVARVRLLICDLAISRFRVDHGRLPDQLAEFVPKYVAELPEDPFSGRPPIYRRLDRDSYTLYSVGYDGRDDGGKSHLDLDLFLVENSSRNKSRGEEDEDEELRTRGR